MKKIYQTMGSVDGTRIPEPRPIKCDVVLNDGLGGGYKLRVWWDGRDIIEEHDLTETGMPSGADVHRIGEKAYSALVESVFAAGFALGEAVNKGHVVP